MEMTRKCRESMERENITMNQLEDVFAIGEVIYSGEDGIQKIKYHDIVMVIDIYNDKVVDTYRM